MKGLKKAISYSLKPHELGFCGPQFGNSQDILRQFLTGKKISDNLIRKLLDEFKGAISYFQLIARSNKIKDHFHQQVIEAYWLGNELLDKVKSADLKNMILDSFTKPELLTKAQARQIVSKIPSKVVAHHSFHVFFVGSVTNRVEITTRHKDNCKVSWGEVIKVFDQAKKAELKTRQLFPQEKEIKMKVDWDKEILPQLKKGDMVSSHWGRLTEKLTDREYNNLIKYTMLNYKAYKKQYGK